MNGGNPAVDNLVTELSPELAGIIGAPPEMDSPPPPKVPGYTAPERDAAKKDGADAAKAARANGIGSRKFGALVAAIPNLDRIRVYKRQPNGTVAYVGEYRYRDIQHTGDIEVFLTEYVKPTYGAGEYPLKLINAAGGEWDGGSVHLIAPPPAASAPQQNDVASIVRELERVVRPAPQPSPLEQVRQTQAMMRELKEASGGDPMMLMMLMQSMNQPKTDPGLVAVLERLSAKVEKLEAAAAAPLPMPMPLPPSPPQMSVAEIVSAVTTSLKTVIEITRPPAAPAAAPVDPFAIAQMLANASKEGAAAAEKQSDRLITMLEQRHNREQPVASLTDEMEKMKTFYEFTKSFSPQQQQAPASNGTNFWDAILAFANNEKFAGNIGEAIRERAKQVTVTSNKPVPPKQITQGPQQPQPPQPAPQPQRPQAPPPPFAPGSQPEAQPPQQPEIVSTAETSNRPTAPRIYLPESFRPVCTSMDEAATTLIDIKNPDGSITKGPDDGLIAQRTIQALMDLFKLGQWRPTVEELLGSIDQDDKEKSMTILGNILGLLGANGWIQRNTAIHGMRVLRDQWDIVRNGVQQLLKTVPIFSKPPPAEEPPTPEAPSTPSAPEAPAAPAAPADVPDEFFADPLENSQNHSL